MRKIKSKNKTKKGGSASTGSKSGSTGSKSGSTGSKSGRPESNRHTYAKSKHSRNKHSKTFSNYFNQNFGLTSGLSSGLSTLISTGQTAARTAQNKTEEFVKGLYQSTQSSQSTQSTKNVDPNNKIIGYCYYSDDSKLHGPTKFIYKNNILKIGPFTREMIFEMYKISLLVPQFNIFNYDFYL
jgi:hypothetical protein